MFCACILNSVFLTAEEITHFLDQVKSKIISQLMTYQELSKINYFDGTTISTFFLLPSAGGFPVILILDLNDYILSWFMYWFNIAIKLLMFLNNLYSVKLYIGITTSIFCMIYLSVIYTSYTLRKWCIIFQMLLLYFFCILFLQHHHLLL